MSVSMLATLAPQSCSHLRAKNSTSIRSSGVTAEWKVSFVRSRTSLAATQAARSADTVVNSLAPLILV